MWQRFTERARKVVFYAQEEAGWLDNNQVSTEHLLLGLLRENDSNACRILVRLNISLGALRTQTYAKTHSGTRKPGEDMVLTPRAKRVIDLAYDEARTLNNNFIGSEHILQGLLREGEGIASVILIAAGLDYQRVRQEITRQQKGPVNSLPPSPTFFAQVNDWIRSFAPTSVQEVDQGDLGNNLPVSQIVIDLTIHIRDTVRPHLGTMQSRRIIGTANSGDATFAIDEIAEEAIVQFIKRENLSVALYSEDKGLIVFGDKPVAVLVIDPIDGTRPAVAGFEQCVVAVSWSDYSEAPTMGDVRYACIAELKQNDIFFAERGKGVRWLDANGMASEPKLLPIISLADAPVSFEAVARPFEYLGPCLSEVVNVCSMKGGAFLYSSTAYSLTRLVTGQLAGVLDIGNRMLKEFPDTRERWLEVGRGKIVALFTYDIAAAVLIAEEAGAIVTDAYGKSLRDVPLLDTSEANLTSMCASSNAELHQELLNAIDRGFAKFTDSRAA